LGADLSVASDITRLLATLQGNQRSLEQHDKLIGWIQALRKQSQITRERPESDFPELIVTVPDDWPTIRLAPLYDVHLGHSQHDGAMFKRHLQWIAKTPNVLTWNGGDLIENASKLSVGSGVYEQDITPHQQLIAAVLQVAPIAHKCLFALPGNHEDRTDIQGFSVAAWVSTMLELPYFPDYAFCTIRWRGQHFRILAHHGSGGSQTAGAQRMAARKDIAWAKPFDLFWTGHLHNANVDVLHQTDVNQRTGRYHERNAIIMISPSYLKFFGTYGAKKRYQPGSRGMSTVILHDDGTISTDIHARGVRL